MQFNQKGDIFTLNGGSLKLIDKVTYFGSSISSTENDINMRQVKAWTVIDKEINLIEVKFIWKKIAIFSPQRSCQFYNMDAPHEHKLSKWEKSETGIAQEFYELYRTYPGSSIP